jgi:hypothetical protein
MVKYLEKAVENFFVSTLGLGYSICEADEIDDIYLTKISLLHESERLDFTIALSQKLINQISSVLLFEDEPDVDTAIDLLKEVANLIIGNLKMVWEESEEVSLELSTPEYMGYFSEPLSMEFDEGVMIEVDGERLLIGMDKVRVDALM